MTDFTKALVGAGFGFLLGIAGEPIKAILLLRLKRRRINDALYSDLGRAYHLYLRGQENGLGQRENLTGPELEQRARAGGFVREATTETYDQYVATEMENLLELDARVPFKRLYGKIAEIQAMGGWLECEPAIKELFSLFDGYFRDGSLDEEKLIAARSRHRDRTFKRINTRYSFRNDAPLIRDNKP